MEAKEYDIVYVGKFLKGAIDALGDSIPEGINVRHVPGSLFTDPKEEIGEQTDWDGNYAGPGKILFVFYFSQDGKEAGIVPYPEDEA